MATAHVELFRLVETGIVERFSAQSDERGGFAFEDLARGEGYVLRAWLDTGKSVARTVEPGATNLRVVLKEYRSLRGVVVWPAGEAPGWVSVAVRSVHGRTTHMVSADPAGNFEVRGLDEGFVGLCTAAVPGNPRFAPVAVGCRAGQTGLELVLRPE